MNVVGGYVVTDRMLQMFRKKPTAPKADREGGLGGGPGDTRTPSSSWSASLAAAGFVIGLHFMNSPATARQGQPHLRERHGRWPSWSRSWPCSLREEGLSTDGAHHHRRRLPHRWRRRPAAGAAGGHDRHAAAGLALQRGGRWRCRPGGHLRLPARRGHARGDDLDRRSSSSSAWSSAASPSPARSSPRASSRVSSAASPSRSPAAR